MLPTDSRCSAFASVVNAGNNSRCSAFEFAYGGLGFVSKVAAYQYLAERRRPETPSISSVGARAAVSLLSGWSHLRRGSNKTCQQSQTKLTQ